MNDGGLACKVSEGRKNSITAVYLTFRFNVCG